MIIAAVVGAYVARSSLRPVRELSAAVEHVSVTKELTPITIRASGDIAVPQNRSIRCFGRWHHPGTAGAVDR